MPIGMFSVLWLIMNDYQAMLIQGTTMTSSKIYRLKKETIHIDYSTNLQYVVAKYKNGFILRMKNSADPDQMASDEAS